MRKLPKTEPAKAKIANVGMRAPTQGTSIVSPRTEFRRSLALHNQCCSCHVAPLIVEWEAHRLKQGITFPVRSCRRHDRDIHSLRLHDLVVADFRER